LPPPRSPLFPYTTLFRSLPPGCPPTSRLSAPLAESIVSYETSVKAKHGRPEAPAAGAPGRGGAGGGRLPPRGVPAVPPVGDDQPDRKSTRLNSSHVKISY